MGIDSIARRHQDVFHWLAQERTEGVEIVYGRHRFSPLPSVYCMWLIKAEIMGISVINKTDPAPGTFVFYAAPDDGYITITKDNTGLSGLKTFFADVTTD